MKKVCAHCGLPAEDHHEFEVKMPDGCQCDPGEWCNEVLPVCAEYRGDGRQYCLTCEHDKECHK